METSFNNLLAHYEARADHTRQLAADALRRDNNPEPADEYVDTLPEHALCFSKVQGDEHLFNWNHGRCLKGERSVRLVQPIVS
jgi:hypothetical protein